MDLSSMSLKELQELQAQVSKAIAGFEARKRAEAIAALEEKAKSLGFTLGELVGGHQGKRKTARAKYANPADRSETWSGRGRRPRWFEAALKAGRSPEDLLI